MTRRRDAGLRADVELEGVSGVALGAVDRVRRGEGWIGEVNQRRSDLRFQLVDALLHLDNVRMLIGVARL